MDGLRGGAALSKQRGGGLRRHSADSAVLKTTSIFGALSTNQRALYQSQREGRHHNLLGTPSSPATHFGSHVSSFHVLVVSYFEGIYWPELLPVAASQLVMVFG